jgi:hypothetical protein
VGSIPIARSIFRRLAYPCVVLGRGSVHRSVPTVSMRLQFIGRLRRSASWSRSFPTAPLVRHRPRSRRAAFGARKCTRLDSYQPRFMAASRRFSGYVLVIDRCWGLTSFCKLRLTLRLN